MKTTITKTSSVPSNQTRTEKTNPQVQFKRLKNKNDALVNLITRSPKFKTGLSHKPDSFNSDKKKNRLSSKSSFQAGLRVGKPGDKYERDADQTAEKIITSPQHHDTHQEEEHKELQEKSIQFTEEERKEPQTKIRMQEEERKESQAGIQMQEEERKEPQAKIQRQEEEERKEPQTKVRMQEEKKEEPRAKASPGENATVEAQQGEGVPGDLQSQMNRSRGLGNPLSESARARLESRFGRDFSAIRIHTDGDSVEMSRGLRAQAFTYGKDIYFNEGKYDTGSTPGMRLLAHELAHTVQQGASPALKIQTRHAAVQREEIPENDFARELAESQEEAIAAVDPVPAEQARKEAQKKSVKKKPKEPSKKRVASSKKTGKKSTLKGSPVPAVKTEYEKDNELGEAGQYLEQESAPVIEHADQKTHVLAVHEKTHDDAGRKLIQSEAAVVPPIQEGQSRGNTEQVETLDRSKPPEPKEDDAKASFNKSLDESVPQKIGDLNEFQSKGKAKVVGNCVLKKVKEDTDGINNTYDDIETAPPAKPPEYTPAPLPAIESAPGTPGLNLGKNAVPPLKADHTDVSGFDRKSDDLLEKEKISEEQLNMVDNGDLYEARKEREGLKKKVTEEPAAIQVFAKQEVKRVDIELQDEEAQSRRDMENKRTQGLGQTQAKQKKTKSAMELKREEVTKNINGIYEKAKQSVTSRLSQLEKEALKTFDQGQQAASKEFEYEVNLDINAWKRKRYSGFWAGAKWVKDKLFGIDDFPEVKQAFVSARSNYIRKIDQLVQKIIKDSQKVIQGCKDELSGAKKKMQAYVKGLAPSLKSAGNQALKEMDSRLKELDGFIDLKKNALVNTLAEKKKEAIKNIDEKIKKMKEEMSGALAKLGKWLLDAAIKFFKWALKKAGYSPQDIMKIIDKGKEVLTKIVTDPKGFFRNLGTAVKNGIQNFVKNIKTHLISGLINWLTGAIGDLEIQMPEKFDLRGIFSIILQILGLTWANIRMKLVKQLGEKVVGTAEKTVDIIQRVIKEGPIALWNIIKEKAAEIKQQVMEGIRNWVIISVVKAAVIKLVSMLNPVGAIIQAILTIYNLIMFFVENWNRIVEFVKTIFNSITDIALGKLGKAAAAVEKAMAMTIPIILSFLARLLNISGISKAIRNIMIKIRKPVDQIIDKGVAFIARRVKPLLAKAGALVKKGKEKVKAGVKKGIEKGKEKIKKLIEWWRFRKSFQTKDGKSHTLKIKGGKRNPRLFVASDDTEFEKFLTKAESKLNDTASKKGKRDPVIIDLIGQARRQRTEIETEMDRQKRKKKEEREDKDAIDKLLNNLRDLLSKTRILINQLMGEEESEGIPITRDPEWTLGSGGFGKKMTAKVLTLKGKPGSPPNPSVMEDTWNSLNKRRGGDQGASFYILGHLLNEQLHGPGNDKRNLTPLSRKGNKDHQVKVEDDVKKAVFKGAVVRYEVNVEDYHNSDKHLNKLKLEDPVDKMKTDIIKTEKFVPKNLNCVAYNVDDKGERLKGEKLKKIPPEKKIDKKERVENKIENDQIENYQLAGEKVNTPELVSIRLSAPFPEGIGSSEQKSVSIKGLKQLAGIDEKRATRLYDNKDSLKSWEDVMKIKYIGEKTTEMMKETSSIAVDVNKGKTIWEPPIPKKG